MVSSLRLIEYALLGSHLRLRRGQHDCPVKHWLEEFSCTAADSVCGEGHSSVVEGGIAENYRLES